MARANTSDTHLELVISELGKMNSAEECAVLVKENNTGNAMVWQTDSKKCYSISGATGLKKECTTCKFCFFDGKFN